MTKCYKLTTQDFKTRKGQDNETQWGVNITHSVPESKKPELCTPSVIHYYKSPCLALLINPEHAKIDNPVLWECETDKEVISDWGESGCFSLTTKRIIHTQITNEQYNNIRVRFAIYCAQAVYKNPEFNIWAENWLLGIDRTKEAAEAAAWAAAEAARAAEVAWVAWVAWAAWAARAAAEAAAEAAGAAEVAWVAWVAWAAWATEIDFNQLANKSFREEFKNDKTTR